MRIITIALQKGGTGKSTTAHALGQGLQHQGFRVLFLDLDPQGNLTYTMQAEAGEPTAFEVMTKKATAKEAIQQTSQGHIIPASPQLSGADLEITQTGKEYRIKEALRPIQNLYDFCIIDTPPALGTLTVNALAAATEVIIPVQADTYSIQGIGQLYSTIDAVKAYCNPGLIVEGILITRYNSRAILSRDLADTIDATASQLGTKLFKTTIREGIAVKEAQARREPLYRYAPNSNPAQDYHEFICEYLQNKTGEEGNAKEKL
jgi:chromosome partitioning protein